MTATNDRRERRLTLGLSALFGVVTLLTGVDLALDLRHGLEMRHAISEGLVVAMGLGGAVWMIARLRTITARARHLGERTHELEAHLRASRAEAERWRSEAAGLISGLSAAIDRQLERWGLSSAEQSVALLLLKGLSHKEVADIRGTSEATVRQQARAIYRKAGLSGRHDLAAFFLEDLLGPRPGRDGGS